MAPIEPNTICSLKEVVDDYVQDPLCIKGKMPARYCKELLLLNQHAGSKAIAEKITMPVYIAHGQLVWLER